MIYALVHYPKVDLQRIHQFRKRYDPQVDLIAPHITLMFPVPESIGEDNLVRHFEGVLKPCEPFLIHLQDVQISSDNYCFLMLQEGSAKVIRLHDAIYTGILADYLRKDIPFVPHLTLGVLNQDSNNRDRALEEAKRLDIDCRCVIDQLHLVKINDDRSRIVWSKEFALVGQRSSCFLP